MPDYPITAICYSRRDLLDEAIQLAEQHGFELFETDVGLEFRRGQRVEVFPYGDYVEHQETWSANGATCDVYIQPITYAEGQYWPKWRSRLQESLRPEPKTNRRRLA